MKTTEIQLAASLFLLIPACESPADATSNPTEKCEQIALDAYDECIELEGADEDLCRDLSEEEAIECDEVALGKADASLETNDGRIITWLRGLWKDRGDRCYAEEDWGCVENNLRIGAWAAGRVDSWALASEAMYKFLDCDPGEFILDFEEIAGASEPYLATIAEEEGVRLLAPAVNEAVNEAAEWATDARPPGGSRIELPPRLVQGGTVGHWMTFAVATLKTSVQVDSINDEGATLTLRFQLRDRYDFHPDRQIDANGSTLGETWTMNAWAQRLVEEGRACEFDIRAEKTETMRVVF